MEPNDKPMKDEKPLDGEVLSRMMLGCLLYRLGGEQTFTPEEINEIRTMVVGVQFFATDDGKIVLRTRNLEHLPGAKLI